jgi:predicted RNase H-like nuclease (RuvC/YqgF family)
MKLPTLYLVEVHLKGVSVGISHSPEERILTTIYRLSSDERNKLHYFKVKFYRILDRHCVFKLRDKYVVSLKALAEIDRRFREIYRDFAQLRKEIYDRLIAHWDIISQQLTKYALKFGIPTDRVEELKPNSPDAFLDFSYSITPLPQVISQLQNLAEQLSKISEYKLLAVRIKREAEEMVEEIKKRYEEKVRNLEETVERLKNALKKSEQMRYELSLKVGELSQEVEDVRELIGEETTEDLKLKLEALKKRFTGEVTLQEVNVLK